MAIKPSECTGVPKSIHAKIDLMEEKADEHLSAHDFASSAHKEVIFRTGHGLNDLEKKLFAARYMPDWTVAYSFNEGTGETLATFTPSTGETNGTKPKK